VSASARLLLISNSTQHGSGYLDHAETEIRQFLGGRRSILFFPFALFDRTDYTEKARRRFEKMGCSLCGVSGPEDLTMGRLADGALFVGGGNTFRLLREIQERELVEPIRRAVGSGIPYVGSSAGSIVAGPTLSTTKDMPIVEPRSFAALRLVPFQISPHYLDPDPRSTHMGETQEERIRQFHEEHDVPVVGLREGAMLRVEDGTVELRGAAGARLFRRGRPPLERVPVCRIEDAVGAVSS
jgi:dipeptidase E